MDEKQAADENSVPTSQPGQTVAPTPEPVPPSIPTADPPAQLAASIGHDAPATAAPAVTAPAASRDSETPLIQWTASEFLSHDKSVTWYAALFGASAVLAAVVFLLTKDKISSAVVLVAGLALGFYARRKPRQVPYALYSQDFSVGRRSYSYAEFRSFSLGQDADLSSISLVPHRRFGQLITLYFHPEDEQLIVNFIASLLPLERRSTDLIESFLQKIRF